ncbi:glycosyltransferase [Methanobrevibacter filiformis]|uniref:Putative teichuronic acid biosynthesis glycosyltransferase TuaC n=1 Tax=Methanobrevibacter filiformis TaxID=55758 RepID=A0A166C3Z6_9EURY|nr:glycosyltransferase [Methanobrevibacter filiformis]KZX11047.1 putative teichuronic acid biosynthesis glycosyltransferase TuaC [Methanobrevibacter filiformis]
MKILVVQESDWLERNPHQQHHLMDRMSLRGHEVRVIDYPIDWRNDESKGVVFNREIHDNVFKINENANIRVIRPSFLKIPVLNYMSLFFTHRKEIKKQIKEFKPDIIISLGIMNAYIASKYAKKHNVPYVYYLIDLIYNLIPEKTLQFFGKIAIKSTIEDCDMIISINQKLKELSIELGSNEKDNVVIDAGIDFNSFNPDLDDSKIRSELNIDEEDTVLFFMGWIYNFAGMKELAIELGKNKDKFKGMKIVIVGDGDAYDDMVQIKKDYNLADQLILTGKQPYVKIPEYLAMADFCLLPAYIDEEIMQDIVPIKLYEYLAMEKVVIATKLPGIYKEFGSNNGIEYVNEAKEVLELAKNIIDNKTYSKIAKSGRNFVKNNDWDKITDKFENTLKKLIKNYNK